MTNLNWSEYANGVILIEKDNSSSPVIGTSSARLVVGSSSTGPYNSVVRIDSIADKTNTFGNDDTNLEKKGSYFGKVIKTALNEGPVYALNILPINTSDDPLNPDQAYFLSLTTDSADTNGSAYLLDKNAGADSGLQQKTPIKNFYNRTKLWYASEDEVIRTKNNVGGPVSKKILSFANMSNRQVTVFVQKGSLNGYDVLARDWYGSMVVDGKQGVDVPSYIHPDDYMSDFIVNVLVINGDWTNYNKLSNDAVFGSYFDANGLIASKVSDFTRLATVNVIADVTGSLIPNFKDYQDNVISIDRKFNNLYASTTMICSIDEDMLNEYDATVDAFDETDAATYRLDLIGHGIFESENDNSKTGTTDNVLIDTLSYRGATGNTFITEEDTAAAGNVTLFTASSIVKAKAYQDSYLYKQYQSGLIATGNVNVGSPTKYIKITDNQSETVGPVTLKYILIEAFTDSTLTTITSLNVTGSSPDRTFTINNGQTPYATEISLMSDETVNTTIVTTLETVPGNVTSNQTARIDAGSGVFYIKAGADTVLYDLAVRGLIIDGTINPAVAPATSPVYCDVTIAGGFVEIHGFSDTALTASVSLGITNTNDIHFMVKKQLQYISLSKPNTLIVKGSTTSDSAILKTITDTVKKGTYLKSNVDGVRPRLLKVQSVTRLDASGTTTLTITTDSPSVKNVLGISLKGKDETNPSVYPTITSVKKISDFITTLTGFKLDKFNVRETLLPDGSASREETILSYMFTGSKIAESIAQNKTLGIRYIIDSYSGKVTSNSKYYLGKLAAVHQKAFAFINLPSIKQFEKSSNPSFVDASGVFDFEYLKTGGNLDLNPTVLFSSANGEYNGTQIASYTYPCFDTVNNKDSKAYGWAVNACNAFQRQYVGGNVYEAVANKRGVLSDPDLTTINYEYSDSQKVILQNLGYNYLITNPQGRIAIWSNNTGYNVGNSALGNAHVRNSLIEIETYLNNLSFEYLFEQNTPLFRLQVTKVFENYLESVKKAGGLYDYTVKMDDSNNNNPNDPNTPAKNRGALIEVGISFNPITEKFVNTFTVNKMATTSTGFIA